MFDTGDRATLVKVKKVPNKFTIDKPIFDRSSVTTFACFVIVAGRVLFCEHHRVSRRAPRSTEEHRGASGSIEEHRKVDERREVPEDYYSSPPLLAMFDTGDRATLVKVKKVPNKFTIDKPVAIASLFVKRTFIDVAFNHISRVVEPCAQWFSAFV
ncbi:hypothetical protein PUN28_006718 [Cardiocondyla obscurior]|uniref:Uncharacterized protein n=1 Tax=Cardiocondyla obscurior TaxID=286306 RepID=A0AAW2G2J5_9HYME